MAQIELIMPKMGESITEATILKWVKNVGDSVELDETILEIATDKVDSEIPSPVAGTIAEVFFQENDVVDVGKVIAMIATEGEEIAPVVSPAAKPAKVIASTNGQDVKVETPTPKPQPVAQPVAQQMAQPVGAASSDLPRKSAESGKFYSPLVRNIAASEGLSITELDLIPGSGMHGRVTKKDILGFLETRKSGVAAQTIVPTQQVAKSEAAAATQPASVTTPKATGVVTADDNVEIIEMDRMRRLIADHMVMSKQTSPHVTSYVEVDVTNIVNWRNQVKGAFQEQHGQKITFTPIFIEAVAKAIRDFPMVNVSVDGTNIIRKKDINIGMAAALPGGNLIVPVIRNADSLNLVGLAKSVNDLAGRARTNQLKPDDIQGGTFTVTNVGTFGNVMGTPIINQPQVAILAVGAIRKKPAVVETEYGDLIAIRHMMFLSLAYDHRVVDGFLGGSFLRKIGDYLEAFDKDQQI
ncbi:MAG: 2-oxo acid dehydrogenase subunit E2 [Bacteroidetes bacterium]|nr:MAG: 2-oxo acid dehydrogenase subunit E2 [Bacteroidota bacterium]